MVVPSPQDFDLVNFGRAFENAYDLARSGLRELANCGFYFRGSSPSARGDGHLSPKSDRMKEAEDEFFRYAFTWIEGGRDKGWTTHYRPAHPPISPELEAVLRFLSLSKLDECPEFEFEECYWRHTPYEGDSDSPFDSGADFAHSSFDAHAKHFAPAIKSLVGADAELRSVGMGFLNLPPAARPVIETKSAVPTPAPVSPSTAGMPEQFDIAVSFAGPQRDLAEKFSTIVRAAGFEVFYDDFYPEQLWGKDLPVFFEAIYRTRARYCAIFVSRDYLDRPWTNQERQSAVSRAVEEKGSEYILPIRVDEVDLPGIASTLGYLSVTDRTIEEIARLACEKLRGE